MIFFLIFGFLIYGSSLDNPFVMDDDMQIVQNVHVRSLDNLSSFFTSSSFDDGTGKMVGIYYKPLMTIYYALVWNVVGNKPIDFRLPLLVIHIASSFLIFLFSLHFLPRKYSMILGLFFLVHPINTEVALYIADAQDIFYFFFGILSLYCIEVIENKKILFFSLVLLFSAGLFSKETGALFLLIGGAYTFFIHPRKKIPVFTSIVIVAVSYLILRWQIGMVHVRGVHIVFQTASFWERLRMLPLILGHYVEIFFFPMRLSVATDFILQEFSFILFWGPLFLVLLFLFFIFKISKQLFNSSYKLHTQFFLVVLLFWFVLHGQMLIPLDGVYADRWFYIGVWGLSSLLIIFAYHKYDSLKLQVVLGFVLLALSLRSYARSLDWQDPLTLYRHEVALHPWDAKMNTFLGLEFFHQKKFLEARPYLVKATELSPNGARYWNNLGSLQGHLKDYQGALRMYEKSLSIEKTNLVSHNYLWLLLKINEREKALKFLNEQALVWFPDDAIFLKVKKKSQSLTN